MPRPLSVLIIEDSPADATLLAHCLKKGDYAVTSEVVETAPAMLSALKRQRWDIVISDHSMPTFDGLTALSLLKKSGLDLPFIIVSGSIGEETAVAAMRAGAQDYIMKNNLSRLVPAIERELREAESRRQHKKAEETINRMAYYDILTDLPNRALFQERLGEELIAAQRENKPLALLLIDLDGFKEVNNTLSHHHGDILLQQVARRLIDIVQNSGMVARLGADEFAAFISSCDLEGATETAGKVLKALEEPFAVEAVTLEVRASIGIALWPDHAEEASTLMQRADVAMYVAKQSATGYTVFNLERDQANPMRLALMGELRHAIDANQLLLHYQPKISLQTGKIVGVEALVRWLHPNRGMLPPDQFVGLAERTGLIKPLTLWVLKTATRQCKLWLDQGIELPVSVNFSVRNLQDPNLPEQITALLQTQGLPPSFLGLEITESILMADPTRAMEILNFLSGLGIELSIDDFGTGYSSLGYLKHLPVSEIKIDKSFVKEMADEDDVTIVRSIIDLAHNLKLRVVAEGVEDEATWNRLASFGCDAAQGYYMARPVPPEELGRWLSGAALSKGWTVSKGKKG